MATFDFEAFRRSVAHDIAMREGKFLEIHGEKIAAMEAILLDKSQWTRTFFPGFCAVLGELRPIEDSTAQKIANMLALKYFPMHISCEPMANGIFRLVARMDMK